MQLLSLLFIGTFLIRWQIKYNKSFKAGEDHKKQLAFSSFFANFSQTVLLALIAALGLMENWMLFSNYRKKKAIKIYIKKLGGDLSRRYGRSKLYTSGQVERTIHEEGYNWKHICYAHALYTSMEHFNQWHYERGENCDYEGMRDEVSANFFGGNSSYIDSSSFHNDSSDSFSSGGGDGGSD